MIGWLSDWINHRRKVRQRWQADARKLAVDQPRTAYYEAHRRAAVARSRRQTSDFLHWSKVAAEVARICPTAEMDIETVKRIVDRELGNS